MSETCVAEGLRTQTFKQAKQSAALRITGSVGERAEVLLHAGCCDNSRVFSQDGAGDRLKLHGAIVQRCKHHALCSFKEKRDAFDGNAFERLE